MNTHLLYVGLWNGVAAATEIRLPHNRLDGRLMSGDRIPQSTISCL